MSVGRYLYCFVFGIVWGGAWSLTVADTPHWIWGSAQANRGAETGVCDFRHTFHLDDPVSGQLKIACDDRYSLRLNGRLIGIGNGWQAWHAYDVSEVLHDGQNEIVVRCRNDEGPAGLAVELTTELVHNPDQPMRQSIVSQAGWQAKVQQDGTWDPTIEQQTPWRPAVALGTVRETEPWADAPGPAESVRVVQAATPRPLEGPFELRDGDRVLFLGNALVERAQQFGYVEGALTVAFPDCDVVFRNLGWSGDTVFGHARARFGSVADGFEHLETHVFAEEPTCVFVAYGANESFAGPEGLPDFVDGLNRLLDVLQSNGTEVVLVTPIPFENLGPPLPDHRIQNENLGLYADAICRVAEQRRTRLVDLFHQIRTVAHALGITGPLTDNGIHLSQLGYWCAANTILNELGLESDYVEVFIDVEDRVARATGAEVTDAQIEPNRIRLSLREPRLQVPSPRDPHGESCRFQIQHLPAGQYALMFDGQTAATADSDAWAAGVSVPKESLRQQANQLIAEICRKNQLYFHRWRPQNETYLFLFRKHEQGNNAVEIPQFDPLIEEVEQSIVQLRRPVVHTVEIQRLDPSAR